MQVAILLGVWVIASVLVIDLFRGAYQDDKKEGNKIEIKYIDFKIKPTLISQIHKCEEENNEFKKAILKGDVDNAIEEYYDNIMVMNNALRLIGVPISTIIEGQAEHFKKLRDRGLKLN